MKPGDVFRVKYPFLRCKVDVADSDPEGQGFATIQSWKPGVEFHTDNYGNEGPTTCDGEGEMVLTVVDVLKPGKYPTRVFFTRRWVRPDGKEFGKGGLHISTVPAFKRRAAGYMHEYELAEQEHA